MREKAVTTGVETIRAQRTEVEARLTFSHAPEGEARIQAWWRLQAARRARLGSVTTPLPALPPPPAGALSRVQKVMLRLGWLTLESAKPAKRFARGLEPTGASPTR